MNETKRKKSRILAAVICVVILLGILGGSAWAFYTNTAVYKLTKGLQNLSASVEEMKNPLAEKVGIREILLRMEEEGGHVETRMNLTTDLIPYNVTLGVDTELYRDMQAKALNSTTAISVMNYELAHLELYGNEEQICFSVPELFLEDLYFDTENVVSQYNDSIFARELFGQSSMEEFSLRLFPDGEADGSVNAWGSAEQFLEAYGSELEACRDNMTISKGEKGWYRASFAGQDVDRLLRELLQDYAEINGLDENDWDGEMEEHERLIASDPALLFEVNQRNQIEKILLESPVELLDGEASMELELSFLGKGGSVDEMQGEITVTNASEESLDAAQEETSAKEASALDADQETEPEGLSVVWQLAKATEEADYQLQIDAAVKNSAEESGGSRIHVTISCGSSEDTFDMAVSLEEEDNTMEIAAKGEVSDIVQGQSFGLQLEELAVYRAGEKLCRITGDMSIEPLQEEITPVAEAKIAVFEMSYTEIGEILYQLAEKYGSLLELLGDERTLWSMHQDSETGEITK
ncbi:MAG: hypothetical protein LUI12_13850 [Clostridiales bacterium]|nr:hypothetical protein [Clostridiales bacterium]